LVPGGGLPGLAAADEILLVRRIWGGLGVGHRSGWGNG
jgi:hypothetical protein